MNDAARLLAEKYGGAPSDGYRNDLARLADGEPLAYVIGWQPFLGLTVWLDSKPLIPRPETEWWTERFVGEMRKETGDKEIAVLDLCAGSGAIGCALLKELPEARVYFGEVDPAHEATIRKNIRENGLDESRADIRIGDLFEPFDGLAFDFIAANPPYVPSGRALPASVSDFEPHQALFADEDGLALIRRIAVELPRRLKHGGAAWIECDSAHAEEAKRLFEDAGMSAAIIPDQYRAPRVIAVSFP